MKLPRKMTEEQARAEIKRRWHETILFLTNNGIYAVGGRDEREVFHVGASRQGWRQAFEDADRREKERIKR